MRILSNNVWGGQLLDELLEYLSCVDADVYCLQEVFDAQVSMTTNMFEIMPRVRIDLFSVLCEHLSGHRGFFIASCEKFPHDPAVGDIPVPYGIATFVRKGISVTQHRAHFVHGEFACLPRGDVPFPRVGHALTVYDRAHEQPITIAHMHGLWDASGKRDTPERARQAILFRLLLSGLQVSGKRIACGDWRMYCRAARPLLYSRKSVCTT